MKCDVFMVCENWNVCFIHSFTAFYSALLHVFVIGVCVYSDIYMHPNNQQNVVLLVNRMLFVSHIYNAVNLNQLILINRGDLLVK